MRVVTLIENTACCPEFTCEHGLSFYIETGSHRILFDAGQTGAFAQNAEKLGVDLGISFDEDSVRALCSLAAEYPCVDKLELLPFRKVCQVKYDDMKIVFPFAHLDSPDSTTMTKLRALIPAALGGAPEADRKEAHGTTSCRTVHDELSSGSKKTAC